MTKVDGPCRNLNHSRSNAPVQYCPQCGKTVNRMARGGCDHSKHLVQRKQGDAFCVHCGKGLKVA